MLKKILKCILKYPIIVINRIYIWSYFKIRKKSDNYKEITPEGNQRILILAPHVDDETIGLGGTIIKYATSDNKISLVYLTDGSGSTSNKSKEDTIKERMNEGYKVKESYGLSNLYFLGEIDGALDSRDMEITNKLVEILENEKPDIIFSPFLIDGNTDHVETTKILSKALEIWNPNFDKILLYQVNTLIDPILVNRVSILDKRLYEEKVNKYKIFASQWAMGFSVFNLLDRGRAIMYKNGFSAEVFIKSTYSTLSEMIRKLEENNFQPASFKQISSEFTLIFSFVKSRKMKIIFNGLVENVVNFKSEGGSSYRAY